MSQQMVEMYVTNNAQATMKQRKQIEIPSGFEYARHFWDGPTTAAPGTAAEGLWKYTDGVNRNSSSRRIESVWGELEVLRGQDTGAGRSWLGMKLFVDMTP